MLRVAIVEDELFMREFLETCICYEEIGLVIYGSFCSAKDALSELQDSKTDLVITDIKMPEMDGITFMSEMLKVNPNTRFLVISNYQDFEIVRSAFRMGICDYIPKTDFELEHYKKTLLAIANEIKMQAIQNHDNQNKQLKERFRSEVSSSDGIFSVDYSEQKRIFALLDILNYDYAILFHHKKDKEQLKESVSLFLEKTLTYFGDGEFFFNEDDKIVLLFSSEDLDTIRNWLAIIRDYLEREFQFILCVFLEESYTKLRDLKVRYAELCRLKKYRFFLPEKSIITHMAVEDFQDNFDCMATYIEMEKLFQENEVEVILLRLEEIQQIKPKDSCVEELLYFYQNILFRVSGVCKAHQLDFLDVDSIKELLAFSNYEKVVELLMLSIKKIAENVFLSEKKLNQRIDEYIQNNYQKKLTLEEMAKYFQYDYSYFSKMFRKIKGVTFKKYLNNVRLEKAEKLIRNSSLKYNEIALEVGYQNYEHFSRSFREKYGCWPSEIERMDANV